MPDIFSSSPPAWMMPVNWIGSNASERFTRGMEFGIQTALERQRLELAQKAQAANAVSQGLDNQLAEQRLKNMTEAKAQIAAAWQQTGGDPVKVLNYALPTDNPVAQQIWNSMQSSASHSFVAQSAQQDMKNFYAQVAALENPKARSAILALPRTQDGLVSPQAFTALEAATADEEALKTERQVVARARAAEARRLGKEVRERYHPITGELMDVWIEDPKSNTGSGMTPWQEAQIERQKKLDAAKLTTGEKAILDSKTKQLSTVEEQIAKMAQEGVTGEETSRDVFSGFAVKPTKQALDFKKLSERRDALLKEINNFKPAGGGQQASPDTAGMPTVTTRAQFDALPSGEIYIGKDGKPYRKP